MCDYKEIAKILEREGIVRVRTWISQERKSLTGKPGKDFGRKKTVLQRPLSVRQG